MAKRRKQREDAAPDTSGERPESVMGYFRRLFQENPSWLRDRSNDKVIERWLADHPGETEMPRNVRNTMANLKSSLRKKQRGKARRAKAGDGPLAANQAVIAPRQAARGLEGLEVQIDECLTLAKNLDREGLDGVIKLLRRARNEVVWKIGQ